MHIPFPLRRSSTRYRTPSTTSSSPSSPSSIPAELLTTTLPLAPREDNSNMSEAQREARLRARCRRATEPWRSARMLGEGRGE